MSHSLFRRLFLRKKGGSEARPPSFGDMAESLTKPGTPSGDAADQEERRPQESGPSTQNAEAMTKVNSLFAFVDLKDPFTTSEIAGEDVPGPILSILTAKQFDSVFLLHTSQTRGNAFATEAEIARRHPRCRVRLQQLPVSGPVDYSSLMGALAHASIEAQHQRFLLKCTIAILGIPSPCWRSQEPNLIGVLV